MSLFALFFLTVLPLLAANSFSFTSTAPSQCDDVQISWTGGSGAGYYLSVVPEFGVPLNISIPSTDVDGTFKTPLALNVTDKFVFTLSDSTGFGSGGSSSLLTVGNSLGGSCNTVPAALPYTFAIDQALQQCGSFPFTDYDAAVAPVSIMGVIPGGDSFVLNVGSAKTFNWVANVYNSTQIIFFMVDGRAQVGGSVLTTVELSSDSSCINDKSPSSTVSPSSTSSPTSTSSSAPSTSSSSAPDTPRSNTGAIAGSVLGALIFLAVLITLGLFFLRQRQEKQKVRMAGGSEFRRTSRPMNSELDLTYDAGGPYMSASGTPSTSAFNQTPSFGASPGPPAHYQPHSGYMLPEHDNPFNPPQAAPPSVYTHNPDVDPFMERESESVSAGQRKSGMSGFTGYKPSRYVVHTDAEDDIPPNADGVVELPPQYSASRAPARALSSKLASPPL
ncbi:hypothetical protein C8R47DRAFT_1098818 [Mycena vitilis]|nr:hypothetical protein C8R47DRAFT_1098818 [Mycena vitilis]